MIRLFLPFIILILLGCGSSTDTPLESLTVKADKIVVIKNEKKMHLYRRDSLLKSYDIALGANPQGHKQREGDEKTPEGKYTIDWHNPGSAYHYSLHISYPNAADKANAKKNGYSPGGDIMIHGLGPNQEALGKNHALYNWTNGCIAVTNEEIDEIKNAVDNGTPIEIFW